MERLRLGIVGGGNMGQSHIKIMANLDLVQIVAVADALEANARVAAALAGGVPFHLDYRELLDRDDVQAVVVATPNYLHRVVTVAALKAGKDVLCEKPMAITVRDCDFMVRAADRLGRKLMAGQVLRLMHPFADIRELISSGKIGRPLSASVTRIAGAIFGGRDPGDWRKSREKTGGMLHEMNAHEVDLLRSIMGEPERVFARTLNVVHKDWDYDDLGLLVLDFVGGGAASLYVSLASGIRQTQGVVICEKGAVDYIWGAHSSARYQLLGQDKPVDLIIEHDPQFGLKRQAEAFARWVLEDRRPEVTGWDGRQAIAIIEAAYQSSRLGRPVKVK